MQALNTMTSRILNHGFSLSALAIKTSSKTRSMNLKRKTFLSHCKYSTQENKATFYGKTDIFKGITVDTAGLHCEVSRFGNILEESLKHWDSEGKRCIWFRVNIKDASFIPILATKGFNFHHARDDYLMMFKWLPKDIEPNLPPASYTNVGVGAMVFNKCGQILTVSEKSYNYPHWKMPGGYVEKGEDLIDAAAREVREETGVESEFESMVTFRHSHEGMFGNSDMYVVIKLRALTEKIVISQREISNCKWMDLEEFLSHPHIHSLNKFVVNKALEYKENNMKLNFRKETLKWATFEKEINYLTVDKYDGSDC